MTDILVVWKVRDRKNRAAKIVLHGQILRFCSSGMMLVLSQAEGYYFL